MRLPRTRQFNVCMNVSELSMLKEASKKLDRPMASVIRSALSEFYQHHMIKDEEVKNATKTE